MDTEADCQLCQTKLSSLKQLRRHVGRHHEELALFALPSSSEENDDEKADGNDSESSDTSSNQLDAPEENVEPDGFSPGEDQISDHTTDVHQAVAIPPLESVLVDQEKSFIDSFSSSETSPEYCGHWYGSCCSVYQIRNSGKDSRTYRWICCNCGGDNSYELHPACIN
jgi:hypothetical protein